MKKYIFFCIALFWVISGYAQNSESDPGRITLAAYIPDQVENIPEGAKSMLINKLNQIVTDGGIGGAAANERFIITANTTVTSKDITPTAPVMTALSLDITFYIGDGIDGTKFATTTVSIKGVGTNATKAYISAFKNINVNTPGLQAFLNTGKVKIVQYYKNRCDFIMKEAQALSNQDNYDGALYVLTSVPEICKECYVKAVDAIRPVYKKQIDKACQVKLAEAQNVWAANQTVEGANKAGAILSQIDPQSACFKDVKVFVGKIAKSVKETNNREWDFVLKQQQQEGDSVKAARDIAIAYANHQPQSVTYNVNGWW